MIRVITGIKGVSMLTNARTQQFALMKNITSVKISTEGLIVLAKKDIPVKLTTVPMLMSVKK